MFKALSIGCLLLSIGTFAHAESQQDLLQTYAIALESDPYLRARVAVQQATGELVKQATGAFLPEVSLTADTRKIWLDTQVNRIDRQIDFVERGYALTLVQPLYRRDLFVQRRQADLGVERETVSVQVVEQNLLFRVAQHYFNVLAAQDDLMFAVAEREAINQQLDEAQKRFEVGLATIIDQSEAQAAFDIAHAAVIEAENALANSKEGLRETSGTYPETLAELGPKSPLVRPDPADIQQWSDAALQQNPLLAVIRFDIEMAREQIDFQRSSHYPTIDLIAQASFVDQSDSPLSGRNDTNQEWIGLQFNLPIFAGGRVSSRTREAGFRLNEMMEIEEQQRRIVLRQTREAYNSVLSGLSRVTALAQAVSSNQQSLQATEVGVDVGTRTTVDVLNARRELFRAKRDYAHARYAYIVNILRLKQAAGILSFNDLYEINVWLQPS